MAIKTMNLTRVMDRSFGEISYMCDQCLHEIDYAGNYHLYKIYHEHTSDGVICTVCGRSAIELLDGLHVERLQNIENYSGCSAWVKRLGQWHLGGKGGSTLCDKPMLGNNHAEIILPEFRSVCEECFDEAIRRIL